MMGHDLDDGDLLGGGPEIEAWLGSCRAPAPGEDFRTRVLASMTIAVEERRVMLDEQASVADLLREEPRVFSTMVMAVAAVVLFMAAPWMTLSGAVGRVEAAPMTPADTSADEPPDVHHALALLDARRDLFAAAQGTCRGSDEF